MAQKIESAGTYLGTISESGLTTTKKGFPQWVARLKVTKKFVESTEEVEHFTKQGVLQGTPAYVDWTGFDEEIVGYQVLFKSATEFSKDTSLLNYEQLQIATGWDGTEFDSLGNGALVGKEILFRVEFNSYTNPETGKVSEGFQVSWIDSKDASPQRQIKSLDAAGIKGLNALLKVAKPAAKPAVAKPVAKPAPAAAAVTPAASATPPTTTVASAPTSTKAPPKAKAKAAPAPATPAPAATPAGPPAETTRDDAWAFVIASKGANEDSVVEEAWISACAEVGENKDDADFTGTDWAKVRDTVLKDLAA